MKKIFLLTALAVLLGVATATAQRIAVVSADGETNVCQTLPQAIEAASPGSVIYLPGGNFSISDEVKITKCLTIIGIGHCSDKDNVDGKTTISGNLFFNEGSSGSAIMGCHITGTVCIGHDDAAVNNVLVRYCYAENIDSHSNSLVTVVNQCYLRMASQIRGEGSIINNNIINTLQYCNSAEICNNIIISRYGSALYEVNNSHICRNILRNVYGNLGGGSNNFINRNMCDGNWGENCVNLMDGTTWDDVFVDYNGGWGEGAVDTSNDFHFTEAYQQYSDIGIYGGTSFNDHQKAPVPYIITKRIAEQTDAAGQLKIQVRVKASE